MKIIWLILVILVLIVGILFILRWVDNRADQKEWQGLAVKQPVNPALYDPAMVDGLPEPAQRFFNYVITPGTPLLTVAEIDMGGLFSLGSRDEPNYQQMEAQQILAAPHGFLWRMQLMGQMPVSGSDSGKWTRFRIFGVIPVARMGGNPDHTRSAFGRYVAEATIWTPAALLPGPNIVWEEVDEATARVTMTHEGMSQAVDITVDKSGQPLEVSMMRWSDANPDNEFRLQPFGATLSDFRLVQGFRLPFRVEAGNMFGTKKFFPFYKAEITEIRFPKRDLQQD